MNSGRPSKRRTATCFESLLDDWCCCAAVAVLALVAGAHYGVASEAGAASKVPGKVPSAANHWAFQPLKSSSQHSLAKVSLDRFVSVRLKEAGLTPGREAGRPTLVRRVAFVLTGLPPTPDEIASFASDKKPSA